MARIEWVRHRLEEWARWCAQQDSGGLGYPKQSAFARLGGKGSRSESVVPINSIEAGETNNAVESLKAGQRRLYDVLTLIYAKGFPRDRVALKMGIAESTVKRNLEDADHALANWFTERKRTRDRIGMETAAAISAARGSCTTYTF